MSNSPIKHLNLPWHQHDSYWIGVYTSAPNERLDQALHALGMHTLDGGFVFRCGNSWHSVWEGIYAALTESDALDCTEILLLADSETPPRRRESQIKTPEAKTPEEVQLIAKSLWLGDALLDDRLMCYLQPVMGASDKIFGYESFARVKSDDGSIIGGDRVVAASKALGIEYMVDRLLHVKAIKTFVSSAFNGFLFVNFFPGFIHRPSVYMEGLSDTAKGHGLIAKHIVLDLTNSETPRDGGHLSSVTDYARSRGYSIALDDITSIDTARRLIPLVTPDFVKIDMKLVRQVTDPLVCDVVRTLVEMTHRVGASAIAEGVETTEQHQVLKTLGVDLFQGYLFSPPVPVEETGMTRGVAAS